MATKKTIKSICISTIASNQGKTMLTTALLYHYRNSVRPFKIGPDFIDPQFHESICHTPSINLDTFIMNKKQVKWMFEHYSDKNISILEGVMGFYDGMDKGCSAYDISKLLEIPNVLLLDGSSSYITVSAVLYGLVNYREGNSIRAVILNRLSSANHYQLIKKQIESDFSDIIVLGWIEKNILSLNEIHLGLNLKEQSKIAKISKDVLTHIDIERLDTLIDKFAQTTIEIEYPFKKISKIQKKLAIVKDKNFSFCYHDNIEYLKEIFQEVVLIDASKDQVIEEDVNSVFISGGYVETEEAFSSIEKANYFKASLRKHAKSKAIYAECAGLLYLGNRVDSKKMSAILDLDFKLHPRFQRMGYYYVGEQRGHSFHYTNIIGQPKGLDILSKKQYDTGKVGSWGKGKIFGTYLHSMFRGNIEIINRLTI
jgi:cobyrinic acid a,c-diamide synthase